MKVSSSTSCTGKCTGSCGCQRPGTNKVIRKLINDKVDKASDLAFLNVDYDNQVLERQKTIRFLIPASPIKFKDYFLNADDDLDKRVITRIEVLSISEVRVSNTTGNNPTTTQLKNGILYLAGEDKQIKFEFPLTSLVPSNHAWKNKLINSKITFEKSFLRFTSSASFPYQVIFNIYYQ
jgi:hypothetical protein